MSSETDRLITRFVTPCCTESFGSQGPDHRCERRPDGSARER